VIKPSPCKTQIFGCLQIPTLKQVPSSDWAILLYKFTLPSQPRPIIIRIENTYLLHSKQHRYMYGGLLGSIYQVPN
jgi:hypothetical protein